MDKPTYTQAVRWIALNDDEDIGTAATGYIVTICLVADLFGRSEGAVAVAVLAHRRRIDKDREPRDLPDDTPCLDTSFHDHEMDV